MAFLSPLLGFGPRLSGGRHHRRQQSRVAKANIKYNNVLNHTPKKFGSRSGLKPRGQKRKQMEGETREKTKKRSKVCCDHNEVNAISNTVSSKNSGVVLNLNNHVTVEILSRLPPKSLLRFKCVCKNWFHLIQKDTTFINLHFERSKSRPRLFVTNQIEYQKKYNLMTFDILLGGTVGGVSTLTLNTIQEMDFTKYDMMLKPVNGLIGFFSNTRDDPGVCICNPSTGEVTPWIESKLLRVKTNISHKRYMGSPNANCTLGYDPATKEHKVVGIWVQFVSTYLLSEGDANDKDRQKIIVAFDVGSEKFRTITVPSYIFDQPPDYDNDDDRNKKHSTSSWTRVTMELPYTLDEHHSEFRINPIPGTNQIILSSYVKTADWKIFDTAYHSYNWKTKSFNEIEISGIPSSVPFFTSESSVAIFFEHLLPLR
ncbi:putative F-box protein At3g47150 [Papaver somniferum]|uniref:putative F-box protein At3g47150 n=1 Tax=Papaver somniferum TaxID=3469 RepID=UPI000E6F9755|nr:putative F-box protein At3g47150 [Papaver somniferum]